MTTMTTKFDELCLPPQNLEAESDVLANLVRGTDEAHEIFERLTPADFYLDRHALLFEALKSQYDRGSPIDWTTTLEELRRLGTFDRFGGDAALLTILDSTPHGAMVPHHAAIVHEKSGKRRLISALEAGIRACHDPASTLADCLDAAEGAIFAVGDLDLAGARPVGESALAAMERLAERRQGVLAGVPTGLRSLDAMTRGLSNGSLIILAARPSMGKTALALNIADHAAMREETGVLFISLEMDSVELAERLLVGRSRVPGRKVQTGEGLTPEEELRIADAYAELRDCGRLHIDDAPTRTVGQIAAIARRYKARHNIGLVVVDYLQLIDPGRDAARKASRQEQVSMMSRRLKMLAKELSLPVLVLSQLNRQAEVRDGHRPRMSDLRESGAIEQDADLVLLLHRPEYYDPTDSPGTAELIIAKNRHGDTGTIRLAFVRDQTRFASLSSQAGPDPEF